MWQLQREGEVQRDRGGMEKGKNERKPKINSDETVKEECGVTGRGENDKYDKYK